MSFLHRLIGHTYRKTEALIKPFLFARQKMAVLKRYPQLKPVLDLYEKHYLKVEYGAHDRSLMERMQRKITEQEQFIYGFTPWTVFAQIMDQIEIQPTDVFVEMGCGTGHLCFFVQQIFGIKTIGIEALGTFITTAKTMQQELSEPPYQKDLANLYFYQLDLLTYDLSNGTIFYMAGTCFPDAFRAQLLERLQAAPSGSWLISLHHAVDDSRWELQHELKALFSWGRDKVLIYRKI